MAPPLASTRRLLRPCLAAFLALLAGLCSTTAGHAEEATVFRLGSPATPTTIGKLEGTATAFVVAPGLLLTNEHVVRGHAQVFVRDVDTDARTSATVLAQDPAVDLALLRAPLKAPALPIGDNATMTPLDPVAVIGFPDPSSFGDGRKLAKGWVAELSAPGRPHLFTMSISMRGGNSGSPVLAANGQVVGVASGGFLSPVLVDGVAMTSQSVGAGVRMDRLRAFLQKHQVPYQVFAYRGDIDDIARAVAPSVFLVEVPTNGTPTR